MSDTRHTAIFPGRRRWCNARVHSPQEFENYRQLLAETKDDAQRRQLEKLLAEEEAKEPLRFKPRDNS